MTGPGPDPPRDGEHPVRTALLIGAFVVLYALGTTVLPIVLLAALWQLGAYALGSGGSLSIGLALLGGVLLFLVGAAVLLRLR